MNSVVKIEPPLINKGDSTMQKMSKVRSHAEILQS